MMSELSVNERGEIRHSEDLQDIIETPPSWLLRWGISLFFGILVLLIGLASFINYPDVIKTQLTVISADAPKAVVARTQGKIIKLLVHDRQAVYLNQPLAYIESTGKHRDVLRLLVCLYELQKALQHGQTVIGPGLGKSSLYQLGELQAGYQTFVQELLAYQGAVNSGFWIKKKAYLQRDLQNLQRQQKHLLAQRALQEKDLILSQEEYRMHERLAGEKVETNAEFREAQSRFLLKQTPVLQTEGALNAAQANQDAKEKDILELETQMREEKAKFSESLNSLISLTEAWISQYVLCASTSGKVTFAGVIQENQTVSMGQELFYVDAENHHFFGQMKVPQLNMGKVKEKQEVLIKLHSFPYEEYGILRGTISQLNTIPFPDSVYTAQVTFHPRQGRSLKRAVLFRQGMLADAEIITEDATVLQRISRNLLKVMHQN